MECYKKKTVIPLAHPPKNVVKGKTRPPQWLMKLHMFKYAYNKYGGENYTTIIVAQIKIRVSNLKLTVKQNIKQSKCHVVYLAQPQHFTCAFAEW